MKPKLVSRVFRFNSSTYRLRFPLSSFSSTFPHFTLPRLGSIFAKGATGRFSVPYFKPYIQFSTQNTDSPSPSHETPPEQPTFIERLRGKDRVILKSGKLEFNKKILFRDRIFSFMGSAFLPYGYPKTVLPDWKDFYRWTFLQVCGFLDLNLIWIPFFFRISLARRHTYWRPMLCLCQLV